MPGLCAASATAWKVGIRRSRVAKCKILNPDACAVPYHHAIPFPSSAYAAGPEAIEIAKVRCCFVCLTPCPCPCVRASVRFCARSRRFSPFSPACWRIAIAFANWFSPPCLGMRTNVNQSGDPVFSIQGDPAVLRHWWFLEAPGRYDYRVLCAAAFGSPLKRGWHSIVVPAWRCLVPGFLLTFAVSFCGPLPSMRCCAVFQKIVDIFAERYRELGVDSIAGFDARGFVLGTLLTALATCSVCGHGVHVCLRMHLCIY